MAAFYCGHIKFNFGKPYFELKVENFSRSQASEILEILEIFFWRKVQILEICSQASESWKSFSDIRRKMVSADFNFQL